VSVGIDDLHNFSPPKHQRSPRIGMNAKRFCQKILKKFRS
jgi:hypothetical protein